MGLGLGLRSGLGLGRTCGHPCSSGCRHGSSTEAGSGVAPSSAPRLAVTLSASAVAHAARKAGLNRGSTVCTTSLAGSWWPCVDAAWPSASLPRRPHSFANAGPAARETRIASADVCANAASVGSTSASTATLSSRAWHTEILWLSAASTAASGAPAGGSVVTSSAQLVMSARLAAQAQTRAKTPQALGG